MINHCFGCAAAGGTIAAGHNVTFNSGLQNQGTVMAGNDVTITGGTFSNAGWYNPTLTTTPGCVAGAKTCKGEANANVQSFSWQEERANVIA
ncbi:hypothetical protein, partial [Andreprevotia chitinilytica]|uniref:hypothetical protein n=1 Tax=Andreprevotia chitinilytica TaxID=396808 RepID=UPI000558F1F4